DTELLASSLVPSDLLPTSVETLRAVYLPRACLTTAATGTDETTFTFSSCLGPNGLLGVSGTIAVHYVTGPSSLHLDVTMTAVKLNGAELAGAAKADITESGANRSMTWSAEIAGTTANAKKFSHTSTHTITWSLGDKCFSLAGTSDGQVRAREIKTDIENFNRCG